MTIMTVDSFHQCHLCYRIYNYTEPEKFGMAVKGHSRLLLWFCSINRT